MAYPADWTFNYEQTNKIPTHLSPFLPCLRKQKEDKGFGVRGGGGGGVAEQEGVFGLFQDTIADSRSTLLLHYPLG